MTETIIAARELNFAYKQQRVLWDITLNLPKGCCITIVGPNGSGKSTLLGLLCGQLRPQGGAVTFAGRSLRAMSIGQRAKHFAVIAQNQSNQFPFTALEMALMGLHPYRARFGRRSAEALAQAEAVMAATDTLSLAHKLVTELSGGEFQRVMLARALLQRPEVLFLDEGMADLDLSARMRMMKLLQRLTQERELTVIAVDHDLHLAYAFSDYTVALKSGRLYCAGATKRVFDERLLAEVFALQAKITAKGQLLIEDNLT